MQSYRKIADLVRRRVGDNFQADEITKVYVNLYDTSPAKVTFITESLKVTDIEIRYIRYLKDKSDVVTVSVLSSKCWRKLDKNSIILYNEKGWIKI